MNNQQRCFLPLGLGLGLAFLLMLSQTVSAATFSVANLADSGPGSLRQAVLAANASPGADEVTFAPGLSGTITLTSGEIVISGSLAVNGPGTGVITVGGNDRSRIFHVVNLAAAAPIDVTLSGLTLTRGYSVVGPGGAVYADSENLTLRNCVISNSKSGLPQTPPVDGCGGNVAFLGSNGGTLRIVDSTLTGGTSVGINSSSGGNLCIYQGSFTLERSTLSGGTADTGAGIYIDTLTGDSTIVRSTLVGNQADESGGAIASLFLERTLTIDSSTLSGNTAGSGTYGFGGGIAFSNGTVRVVNSTISGNSAARGGGGIQMYEYGPGSLLLRLSTVSNNTAGLEGGSILISNPAATAQLDHSIVANGAPQDLASFGVAPPTLTANYTLIEAPGDALLPGANNLVGMDPALGPLASNGGPTLTHQPSPNSPVLDAGNAAIPTPPASDQRGEGRIIGAAVDLGAVEGQSGIIETPTLSQVGLFGLAALLLAAGVRRLRSARAASS